MPRLEASHPSGKPEGSLSLRRSLMLSAGFALWMVLIVARLYYLQIIKYASWVEHARGSSSELLSWPPNGVSFTTPTCALWP